MEIAVGRETQYRRVLIRNTQDDKLFKVNVDLANWTEDALYALGAVIRASLNLSVTITPSYTARSIKNCKIR